MQLQLAARLNLKDAMAVTKNETRSDIDLNDPSILALQQSFAEANQKKEANKSVEAPCLLRCTDASRAIFVKDNSLRPAKGGRNAILKAHRVGLFGGHGSNSSTTKSLPTSPSLGGITPQPGQRDAKSFKQDAIKRALIHLLAIRPVSEKYLLDKLQCDASDLKPLLEKYGREWSIDKRKYNLSDRGYKELDVWSFDYTEDDRQQAVDRAVAAFDRQRISIVDPLWQKLLPKNERNKGKVLSKLGNLHHGTFAQAKTPRINVESAAAPGEASDKEKQSEEERNGMLAPDDGQVRSRSQDPVNKKKVSEREAQSKRLFAKDPQKAADMAKAKVKAAAEAEKKAAKKAAPKKATSKNASSQFKSAEFVHSSDEESGHDEASQTPSLKRKAEEDVEKTTPTKKQKEEPKAAPKASQEKKTETKPLEKKAVEKKPLERKVEKKVVEKPKADKKPQAKELKKDTVAKAVSKDEMEKPAKKSQPAAAEAKKTQGSSNGLSTSTKPRIPESQRPAPMARTLSHKRSGSSPVKPSPLGSSPPTNASDLDTDQVYKVASSKSSSSSGSPLINQRRERLEAQRIAARAAESKSSNVDGSSDRPLKRRANDLDSAVHQHGVPSAAAPVNGGPTANQRAAKRPRLPESPPATSPESDKAAHTTSSGDLSPVLVEETSPSPRDLEYARLFKRKLQSYDQQRREILALSDPPLERVERLQRMYAKLVEHKETLWKMAGGRQQLA